MKKIGIFYGSSSGNTENAAAELANLLQADTHNVANNPIAEVAQYDCLVLGASTWGVGDLQDDWDVFLPRLAKADLAGKTVAFFGLGDASGYADSFVDGMGIIFDEIKDKGCQFIGQVATDAYSFDSSRAVVDGHFVGLPLDEDNESSLTSKRLQNWATELLQHLN